MSRYLTRRGRRAVILMAAVGVVALAMWALRLI